MPYTFCEDQDQVLIDRHEAENAAGNPLDLLISIETTAERLFHLQSTCQVKLIFIRDTRDYILEEYTHD